MLRRKLMWSLPLAGAIGAGVAADRWLAAEARADAKQDLKPAVTLPVSRVVMFNSGVEILQSPGYVVIRFELIHETRIIPLDGRRRPGPAIRPWLGEPRGRWDGRTLVVETTNFNGRTPMLIVGPGGGGIPTSESMRIVERFNRVDEDTIDYEVTVEDPIVLTAPWKAAFPLKRDPGYYLFEYACHEGNQAISNALRNSRVLEARPGR